MNKEAINHIKKCWRDYNKSSQRAELLARNVALQIEFESVDIFLGEEFHKLKFLSEDKVIDSSKDNILLKMNYPKNVETEKDFRRIYNEMIEKFKKLGPLPYHGWYILDEKGEPGGIEDFAEPPFKNKLEEVIFHKNNVFNLLKMLWLRFCNKWHIDQGWNGKFENIGKFQGPLIEIVSGSKKAPLPISIKISPWTSLEDIKKEWHKIEKIQKIMFFKEEKTTNFARDLCWFDLNKKFNLRPREIAELWIKKFPKDIDLIVLRRIKNQINKQDLEGRAFFDDSELLHEIKCGFLQRKYKPQFDLEREFYITGKTEKGKYSPRFHDVIKKAIRRFDERIRVMDLPPGF